MNTCSVCCDRYNLQSRKKIDCQYCDWKACSACNEKYLLETSEDAHCMSCRKGWSRENLVANFTQKFVSHAYKLRREALLLERERSLMPATQPFVEVEKKIRVLNIQTTLREQEYQKLHQRMVNIFNRTPEVMMAKFETENRFDAEVMNHKEASEIKKQSQAVNVELEHIAWHKYRLAAILTGTQIQNEKRRFVRACPFGECRGFLSTVWKCGLCENWACPECHEVKGLDKDAPHTCDPNNIATAQLMARDTRNCPKCAANIFKIDGCDQMWCTQCHTAFSWRTGLIETHTVHNPHYYDFLRQRGEAPRAHGDIPCGGFPDWYRVQALLLRTIPSSRDARFQIVQRAHRSHPHVYYTLLPRYTARPNEDNRDLRIKLMIGDFGEDEFKRKIQQREKARQRKTDIRQVMEMYTAVLNDLFQTFSSDANVEVLTSSLLELKNHTNETLERVSRRWSKCAVPRVTEFYDVV